MGPTLTHVLTDWTGDTRNQVGVRTLDRDAEFMLTCFFVFVCVGVLLMLQFSQQSTNDAEIC